MGNKIKIVIASVLKPVDDTRMYEKFGLSLQQTNRYQLNIIGFVSKNPPKSYGIKFYPLFNFKNSSWKRFFAPFIFAKYLFKIAPHVVIITTFELLPAVIIYKLCKRRSQLVYDVVENYALNFETNRKHSLLVKMVAKAIRFLEKTSQSFVKLNILAEISYAKEISFFSKKSLYVLNKYKDLNFSIPEVIPNIAQKAAESYPVLIFNGTISKNYGIFEAIDLAKALKNYYPDLLLIVAGHVTQTKLFSKLIELENLHECIFTKIAKDPIPHSEIIKLLELADFGLVAHRPVKSIKNCFPTRIYEYMAHLKPFILQKNPYWTSYCDPWKCAINIDFKNFEPGFVAQQMKSNQFYPKGIPEDIYWEPEAVKLIQAMDKISGRKI